MYRSGIIDDVKVVETSVLGDDRAVGSGGKVSSGSLKRKTASAGLTVF
ncbi:RebB protein [Capnocytophaga sp. oral taxon 338 str. F0234]|nr:RebB protein [Capnocytophaga sp. oral taxon 338 str. F0234]